MSRNHAVLDRFHAAIQRRDLDEVAASIEDGFVPDAVMLPSDSLPYGGAHRGRDASKGVLTKLVTTRTPIVQPDQIVAKRVLEEGDQIAGEPDFPWLATGASEPIRMSAVEWFTFEDARVTEMKVGYWDTAGVSQSDGSGHRRAERLVGVGKLDAKVAVSTGRAGGQERSTAVPAGFEPFRGAHSPFLELIGPLWIREADRPATFGVVVEERHANSVQICHGGLLATLADLTLGHGVREYLGSGASVVTADLNVRFLAPAEVGAWLQARAVVEPRENRRVLAECELTVGPTVVAHARAVYVQL